MTENKKIKRIEPIVFINKNKKITRFINEGSNFKWNAQIYDVSDLFSEINTIKDKALDFGKDFVLLYNQYMATNRENRILREKNRLLIIENERLKKEVEILKSYNTSLTINDKFKKERKISDLDISKIQNMKREGLSYRDIEKKTGWSKYTIGKAINNKYKK